MHKMRDDFKFNVEFCKIVEKFQCLYDKNHSDYCNRSSQDEAWQKLSVILDVPAADCKERWRNLRGRYSKYKRQMKLNSGGSASKKVKTYYLAKHLHFLDSFLSSRPSRGNIVNGEESVQQEEDSYSGDFAEVIIDELDEIDVNQPMPDDMLEPNAPLSTQSTEQSSLSDHRKRTKTAGVTLSGVNSSDCKYFEAKKRLLEQKQPSSNTNQPDPDMAFLQSVLPDMKAMNERQKRMFKMGVLKLADETLNAGPSCKNS